MKMIIGLGRSSNNFELHRDFSVCIRSFNFLKLFLIFKPPRKIGYKKLLDSSMLFSLHPYQIQLFSVTLQEKIGTFEDLFVDNCLKNVF